MEYPCGAMLRGPELLSFKTPPQKPARQSTARTWRAAFSTSHSLPPRRADLHHRRCAGCPLPLPAVILVGVNLAVLGGSATLAAPAPPPSDLSPHIRSQPACPVGSGPVRHQLIHPSQIR